MKENWPNLYIELAPGERDCFTAAAAACSSSRICIRLRTSSAPSRKILISNSNERNQPDNRRAPPEVEPEADDEMAASSEAGGTFAAVRQRSARVNRSENKWAQIACALFPPPALRVDVRRTAAGAKVHD